MSEIEIAGNIYSIAKLPARKQLHIARRLLPVADVLVHLMTVHDGELPLMQALGALADTVGKLSDADFDYILDHCLEAVRRKSGLGFQAVAMVTPQGSRLLFEDLDDMSIQLRLIWEVIRTNLENFSLDLLLPSPPASAQAA